MRRYYSIYNTNILDAYSNYFYVEDVSGDTNNVIIKNVSTNVSYNDLSSINLLYSYDSIQWIELPSFTSEGITIHIPKKSKVYFKGINNRLAFDKYDLNNKQYICYINFTCEKTHNIGGNTMSLLYGDEFIDKIILPKNNNLTFYGLFQNSLTLNNAERLILPATTLTNFCYQYMFNGCSNLKKSPVTLPAETATNNCYQYMFQNCSSLETSPELQATKLSQNCYNQMFYNCNNLTMVQSELPATILAKHCYQYMFYNCTKLTVTPKLPATNLVDYCYSNMFNGCSNLSKINSISGINLAPYCYYNMFQNCINLENAPELPATTLYSNCYTNMFAGCKKLITAPELPATTLAEACYQSMFSNCSSLINPPSILPATNLTTKCYYNMFNGCTNLINSPILPSSNLANNCYQYMFQGCSKLNYVTALFINYSNNNDEFTNWLNGVSSTGTFVRNNNINYNVEEIRGKNGIPSNWNVITEE